MRVLLVHPSPLLFSEIYLRLTESRHFTTRDYRLFDVQHAVLPPRLPLQRFYEEFVRTQDIINRKHLGWRAVYDIFGITMRLLARGQTNFVRMLWKFGRVYNVERLLADHARPVRYAMALPEPAAPRGRRAQEGLYVHHPTAVAPAS